MVDSLELTCRGFHWNFQVEKHRCDLKAETLGWRGCLRGIVDLGTCLMCFLRNGGPNGDIGDWCYGDAEGRVITKKPGDEI